MMTWDGRITVAQDKAVHALIVVAWPLILLWWLFLDYVWWWLWRVVLAALAGIFIGLLFRTTYMGDDPRLWWWWPW